MLSVEKSVSPSVVDNTKVCSWRSGDITYTISRVLSKVYNSEASASECSRKYVEHNPPGRGYIFNFILFNEYTQLFDASKFVVMLIIPGRHCSRFILRLMNSWKIYIQSWRYIWYFPWS